MLTGRTKVAGVIGWPVEHSLSPAMHNAELERLGLDWVYVPFPVPPDRLEAAVRGLAAAGVAGINVTIPHKQAVMALVDDITPEAAAIGAVNTLQFHADGRITGTNTDAPGWVADIQQDILLAGSSVCILGAGGASRALAVGAAMAGARRVAIYNRTGDKARSMCESLEGRYPGVEFYCGALEAEGNRELFTGCEIIVNATSVGMLSNPGIPIPADWLQESQYVYDTIYTPGETELLRVARQTGCATRNGAGMLARQGALAFELWTGVRPDADRMESIIRRNSAG